MPIGGGHPFQQEQYGDHHEDCVSTSHAFTGRMCAASRHIESQRTDSLFHDPLAQKLAGQEGMRHPMGEWIMVPRTRFGDDLVEKYYSKSMSRAPCRQLVLLGAGMDARAYRLDRVPELRVFEVDQDTTFAVKEPLLCNERLKVKSRHVVATDFSKTVYGENQWAEDLVKKHGFEPAVPTVWLLEGLLMYLDEADTVSVMKDIGRLSAAGSVVFHDAISKSNVENRIVVGGAPFIGGSDEYKQMWAENAGFGRGFVRDFNAVAVDRQHRRLLIDDNRVGGEATPEMCRGRDKALFVVVEKYLPGGGHHAIMPSQQHQQHHDHYEDCVSTSHAYTGRMCAASRHIESQRPDSLFIDPFAKKLAGQEGMRNPMGDWIMVPRTRYGDDLVEKYYRKNISHSPCRQLVLLGAGMDARAYRLEGVPELRVFEVDQDTTFKVKEPLLCNERLKVKSRHVVATDFSKTVYGENQWAEDLVKKHGFEPAVPTVWLLEGLMMYLGKVDAVSVMRDIGWLSAAGSVVFHDAITKSHVDSGIVVGGAPFIGGSDEYKQLWAENAGFVRGFVRDFNAIAVDRRHRRVLIDDDSVGGEATPEKCRGRIKVLFVEVEK